MVRLVVAGVGLFACLALVLLVVGLMVCWLFALLCFLGWFDLL